MGGKPKRPHVASCVDIESLFLPEKRAPHLAERLEWSLSSDAKSGLLSYEYDDRRRGYRLYVVKDSPVHIWAATGAPFFEPDELGQAWRVYRERRGWRD